MRTNQKVVLFYPPYDGPLLGAPLSLLTLRSPLLAAGFDFVLVGSVTSPDFENVILGETDGALCWGISLLTGPMIRSAIRVVQAVRKLRAHLRIIFGRLVPDPVAGRDLRTPGHAPIAAYWTTVECARAGSLLNEACWIRS